MMFRLLQGSSFGIMLTMWIAKSLIHPGRPHLMLLAMSFMTVCCFEIGYRAGRNTHASPKVDASFND